MNPKSKSNIHSILFMIMYIFINMIFMTIYIFLGEDIALNTFNDYAYFNICCLLINIFSFVILKYSIRKIYKLIIFTISLLSLPILTFGLLGTINVSVIIQSLIFTRMLALILNIFILIYSFIKIIIKPKLKNDTH